MAFISLWAQEIRLNGSPGGHGFLQPGLGVCAFGWPQGTQKLDQSPDLVEETSWASQPEFFPVRNPVPRVARNGTRVLEGWTVPGVPSSSSLSAL